MGRAAFSLWRWASWRGLAALTRIHQMMAFDGICKEVELIKFTFINQWQLANGLTLLWELAGWQKKKNKKFLPLFKAPTELSGESGQEHI